MTNSAPNPKSVTSEAALPEAGSLTLGIDHLGLNVADLEQTLQFFQECLGWALLGRKEEYPAAFVTDQHAVLTLWQVERDRRVEFDRRTNVGLHHLALRVGSLEQLHRLHERVARWPGVRVEFSPELSGRGPKTHFMVSEPGGLRLEFSYDPRRDTP
jgi:catechol 2,3-dioxygenase-like lactoylglutathione lyase family enzyme